MLMAHGIPADADSTVLMAALAARGWQGTVEEEPTHGGHRFRAMALRMNPPSGGGVRDMMPMRRLARGRGPTVEAALARVLAEVLRRNA